MTRMLSSKLLLAAAAATFTVAAAHSATDTPAAAPPWKAKNLQVLPPDMPREQLIGIMKRMSTALGVQCTYCHVEVAGGPPNFVSDVKREKEMARWMLRVTHDINQRFEVDMNAPEVTCYTCHRGEAKPAITPPEPAKAS